MPDKVRYTAQKNKSKNTLFIFIETSLFCALSYLLMTSGIVSHFEAQYQKPIIIKATCCAVSFIITLFIAWVFYDFTYDAVPEVLASEKISAYLRENSNSKQNS